MRINLGSIASSVRKKFSDSFDRTDQSGLGTSSDGSIWSIIRGSFSISSNKAVGADNNYPMAAVNTPMQDVSISITEASQGASAALWVTGSGDWWAVGIDQAAVNCNCSANYSCYGYNTSNCNSLSCLYYASNADSGCAFNCSAKNAATCGGYAIMGYNASNCKGYNAYNAKTKTGGNCTGYNASNAYYSPQGWANCTGFTSGNCIYYNYFCNSYGYSYCVYEYCIGNYNGSYCNYWAPDGGQSCQTCYPQYIRIIKSVGSTISEIASWTVSSIANSFRVKTTGSQITIQAFSDSSLVSQIDSDIVYTPTGVSLTSEFGLTIKPSSYNQGYSVGSITIDKN